MVLWQMTYSTKCDTCDWMDGYRWYVCVCVCDQYLEEGSGSSSLLHVHLQSLVQKISKSPREFLWILQLRSPICRNQIKGLV